MNPQQPDAGLEAGSTAPPTGGRGGVGGSAGAGAAGTGAQADAPSDAGGTRDASDSSDAATGDAADDAAQAQTTTHVYVSGYGTEITHFTLERENGALARVGATGAGTSPSYLAIAPDGAALYAVNEGDGDSSQVLAFAIDAPSGALAMINAVPSGGDGAPHLSVHPSGQWVAVAHYGSGHTSVLPVRGDRGLNAAVTVDRGPSDGARKAHQAVFDLDGANLLVPCLESNYVLQYRFSAGALTPNTPATVAVAGGPRHLALTPDERHAYVLSELDSLITSFDYDADSGRLSNPQTIDSQQETKGASAHIAVHPSGRWLYASNRAENSLGLFSIDADGRPHAVAFEREGIATPRDFAIDPLGEFLILANQNGGEDLRVYRIDPDDGRLTFVRTVDVGGSPTCVAFTQLPPA